MNTLDQAQNVALGRVRRATMHARSLNAVRTPRFTSSNQNQMDFAKPSNLLFLNYFFELPIIHSLLLTVPLSILSSAILLPSIDSVEEKV